MIKEIAEIIDRLNNNILEYLPLDFNGFTMSCNGYDIVVYFLGIEIWSSVDDARDYENEEDFSKEPYLQYFKKQSLNIIERLQLSKKYISRVK